MTTKQTYGTETGCVFDSSRGIYIPMDIVDLARSWGWEFDGMENWEDDNDHNNDVYELSDDAIDWLNATIAAENYSFGWWEGNVMYWSAEDWDEAYS